METRLTLQLSESISKTTQKNHQIKNSSLKYTNNRNQDEQRDQLKNENRLKITSRQTKKFQSEILMVNSSDSELNNQTKFQKLDRKQDCLMSYFTHINSGLEHKFLSSTKISPIYLVHKIQESKPNFGGSILNKQILFDVLIEKSGDGSKAQIILQPENGHGQSYQIYNCVSASRPNSEIYKRLSKKFFENLQNGVDQCMLFLGAENESRLETSIGNNNNPGMLMIVAIAVLDEKYKDSYERFDIQMSFLEYRNEKMYDLLNYTQCPLKMKEKQNLGKASKLIQFGQQRVKICTFLQFIKHFKIALFNNKERDFKDKNKNRHQNFNDQSKQQSHSTFIMKIRIKKYNIHSQLINESEIILIDFQESTNRKMNFKKIHNKNSQQITQNNKENKNLNSSGPGRSLLEYILIELNNSNPHNKSIHYHMVQKNLILALLKKYLRRKESKSTSHTVNSNSNIFEERKDENSQHYTGGQVFLINSMPNKENYFEKNIENVEHILQCVGLEWEAYVYKRYKFNKYFNSQYSDKILENLVNFIKVKKYQLYKDLEGTKCYFIEQAKRLIVWIGEYKSIILEYIKYKKDYKYLQNIMVAYQLQLIGNCIKSDNFKDFYASKIYLALPRQLQIKTQSIKQQIKKCISDLQKIEQKYIYIKKKQNEVRKFLSQPPLILINRVQTKQFDNKQIKSTKISIQNNFNKFKGLNQIKYQQFNGLENFLNYRKYILEFFYEIWYKVNLSDERTITEEIIFQNIFYQQTGNLKAKIKEFISNLEQIDQSSVKCGNDQRIVNHTKITQLLRSLHKNSNKFLSLKNHTQTSVFKRSTLKIPKKENMCLKIKTNYLPKICETQQRVLNNFQNKQKYLSISQNRKEKYQMFKIYGKLNFQNLLLIPKKNY